MSSFPTVTRLLTSLAALGLMAGCDSNFDNNGRSDIRKTTAFFAGEVVTGNAAPELAAATSDNLFAGNEDFENGTQHWHACEDQPVNVSNDAHKGNFALALQPNECVYRSILVSPGETYQLSCHVKLTNPQPWTGIGMTFSNEHDSVLTVSPSANATSTNYVKLESTATAPAGTHFVSAWFHSEQGALIDQCSLKPVGVKTETETPVTPATPVVTSNLLENPAFTELDGHGGARNWQHGCNGFARGNGSQLTLGDGACVDQAIDASELSTISSGKVTFSCALGEVSGYSDMSMFLNHEIVANQSIDTSHANSRVEISVDSVSASNGFVSLYSEGKMTVKSCELSAQQADSQTKDNHNHDSHSHTTTDGEHSHDHNTNNDDSANQKGTDSHTTVHTNNNHSDDQHEDTQVTDTSHLHDHDTSEHVNNQGCEHTHHWSWNHNGDHDTWDHEHHNANWTKSDNHNWS